MVDRSSLSSSEFNEVQPVTSKTLVQLGVSPLVQFAIDDILHQIRGIGEKKHVIKSGRHGLCLVCTGLGTESKCKGTEFPEGSNWIKLWRFMAIKVWKLCQRDRPALLGS